MPSLTVGPLFMNDSIFPLAYLITIRCYGTWLHGDARESVDRREHHIFGTPRIAPQSSLESVEVGLLKHPPIKLEAAHRVVVEKAIQEVCQHRGHRLLAVNARTNHVHTVVSAKIRPEPVMNAFKAYATRHMREAGILPQEVRPWSRHGSTIYLWKPRHVARAVDYVVNSQGGELPRFDDDDD